MCSEARGLPAWPRKAGRWLAFVAALTLAAGALSRALDLAARGGL